VCQDGGGRVADEVEHHLFRARAGLVAQAGGEVGSLGDRGQFGGDRGGAEQGRLE
jgi:hypothetical protein